jgi:(p)ppGpp synthase/HD superfamily hydrolase
MEIVNPDADALEVAIELAVRAHRGQRYPSPEPEPFINHPLRVMLAVGGFRAQAAAVLHDVLEDTTVTVEELRGAGFSSDVVDAVIALTRSPGQTSDRASPDRKRSCRAKHPGGSPSSTMPNTSRTPR